MTAPFTPLDSNNTITTTERSIVGDTTTSVPLSGTTYTKVRVRLDLSALAAGDEFELRVYEKVDAGTQRTLEVFPLVGTYSTLWASPEFWLYDGYDITLKKTAGTDRAIRWAVVRDVGEVTDVSGGGGSSAHRTMSVGGYYPVRNDADAYIYFWLGLASDPKSPAAGINTAKLTFFWMAPGATSFTNVSTDNASATATDCGSGWYRYSLDSTRVDDGDGIGVFKVVWTAGVVTEGEISPENECYTRVLVAGVDANGVTRAAVRSMEANTVTASAVADGAIDAGAIAADALAMDKFAVDTKFNLFGALDIGQAQAGAATTITLRSGASATNSRYVGCIVVLTGDTGQFQVRRITGYVGSTKVATISPNWDTNPDATSDYVVLADGFTANVIQWIATTPNALSSGRVDASVGAMAANVMTAAAAAADLTTELQAGLATAANLTLAQSDLDDIQSRLPAALVGGRMDSSVGAMAANVITAAATAADFGTEVATAVWDFVVENSKTAVQFLRVIKAGVAGKAAGFAGATRTYRDDADTKDRITATVDTTGRTAVTLDGT